MNLLNFTQFSYRVRAYNSTGYSDWSPYSSETTLIPSAFADVAVITADTVLQTYIPPQNLVTLYWETLETAVSYRLYELNLLIEEDITEVMFTDGLAQNGHPLETNTTYRYVVTGMNTSGESSPSELWASTTLPEIAPPVPVSYTHQTLPTNREV